MYYFCRAVTIARRQYTHFTNIIKQAMRPNIIYMAAAMLSVAAYPMQDGEEPIPLRVGRINPTPTEPPHPKSPIQIPLVYQDGNTLTFATPCTGCTLQLLDAEGEIVYETTVASGTTSVILPASLSGTFELRLIYGGIYFYGDIVL